MAAGFKVTDLHIHEILVATGFFSKRSTSKPISSCTPEYANKLERKVDVILRNWRIGGVPKDAYFKLKDQNSTVIETYNLKQAMVTSEAVFTQQQGPTEDSQAGSDDPQPGCSHSTCEHVPPELSSEEWRTKKEALRQKIMDAVGYPDWSIGSISFGSPSDDDDPLEDSIITTGEDVHKNDCGDDISICDQNESDCDDSNEDNGDPAMNIMVSSGPRSYVEAPMTFKRLL